MALSPKGLFRSTNSCLNHVSRRNRLFFVTGGRARRRAAWRRPPAQPPTRPADRPGCPTSPPSELAHDQRPLAVQRRALIMGEQRRATR
eukprot:7391228-Prymnesium_polylepis.2